MPAATRRTAATRSSPPPISRCGWRRRAGPRLSVNPARIDGGGPNNVVPDHAVLRVNLRPATPDDERRAQRAASTRPSRWSPPSMTCAIHLHGGFGRPPKPIDARRRAAVRAGPRLRRRSRPDDRLAADRRRLRRQQYRGLRRAGGRHDGRARRRDPFGRRISDRRQPRRARARCPRWCCCAWPSGAGHELPSSAPPRPDDLDALYEMAKLTGGGFTNLPPDRGALTAKLARAAAALRQARATMPGDDLYRPRAGGHRDRPGASAPARSSRRSAQRWPFYSYRLGTLTPAQPANSAAPSAPRC